MANALFLFSGLLLIFFLLNRVGLAAKLNIQSPFLIFLSDRIAWHIFFASVFTSLGIFFLLRGESVSFVSYVFNIAGFLLVFLWEVLGLSFAFRPLKDLYFLSAQEAEAALGKELTEGDVLGIEVCGEARAYPVYYLKMRHLAHDEIAGKKFL